MNCTNCGNYLAIQDVEADDAFCSERCRAEFEHTQKLRENECMTVHVSSLDDGGYTLELHLRDDTTGTVNEMTKNYESYEETLRGLAALCLSVAESIEKGKGPE